MSLNQTRCITLEVTEDTFVESRLAFDMLFLMHCSVTNISSATLLINMPNSQSDVSLNMTPSNI